MKKQSLWLDTASAEDFPSLSGQVEVDVLVVGGGITGLTTAYLLKKAGKKVAVVDQQDIASGETAHTTAHLTFVTDSRLHELVHSLGEKEAQGLWDAGSAAMHQIEEIAEELQIDCELKRVPGYLFAALDKDTEQEAELLQKDAELASHFGYDVNFIESDPLYGRPALRFPNQLKFHPLKYVYALAKAIPGEGSHVFAKTSGSEVDADQHELKTEKGHIRYQVLVAATHVPIQGERGTVGAALFQTKLAGYSTYAIEAEIPAQPEALYWDTNDPYLYIRFDKRGETNSIIIGGEDHKTGQEADTEGCYQRLVAKLKAKFPLAKLVHRWSGQVIETPDGLPFIGAVGEHQYLATGFSGNGITLGTFSAMLIRDEIMERSHPWGDLFAPNRKRLAGTWEYLKENKDFPAYFIKEHLAPAGSSEGQARCTGELVKVNGKKTAVYCDEHGKRTELSPVCPHMGCIVGWNPAEKTWDCPCHGSRFAATGELISGPAETGLAPAKGE